jgi:hypothetical protein
MNRGVIVGNQINLISKIVLKYAKHKVLFSCCTPLCVEGSIHEGKCYKFKLLIPRELFPETGIKTFHGARCDEYIRMRVFDLTNKDNRIYLYFRIDERRKTHLNMYCLETVICSEVAICNPVLFFCGTLLRKHGLHRCVDIEKNNASSIKLFIEEVPCLPDHDADPHRYY